MPEIVITENATQTELEGAVEPSWRELLDVFNSGLQSVTRTLATLVTAQQETVSRLEAMAARVPENLTTLISEQQATNARLVAESMETVRSLLTPPAPAVVVEEPPVPAAEAVLPVVEPVAVVEPAQPPRKRRAI